MYCVQLLHGQSFACFTDFRITGFASMLTAVRSRMEKFSSSFTLGMDRPLHHPKTHPHEPRVRHPPPFYTSSKFIEMVSSSLANNVKNKQNAPEPPVC
jgi:hypothetical protein